MTNSKTVLTTATAVKMTLGDDNKYHLSEAVKVQNLKVKTIVLAKQPNKEGMVKIYIQVMQRIDKLVAKHFDGVTTASKPTRISTGVWVLPNHWSKVKEEILKGDSDYIIKNEIIGKTKAEILAACQEQNNPSNLPTVEKYKQLLKVLQPAEKKYSKDLTEYCQQYINHRIASGTTAIGTIANFHSLKNRLLGFQTQNGKRYFFEDVNTVFADNFRQYLFDADLAKNTIFSTFELLIAFLNHFYARRSELNINLSDNFKQKNWKGVKKSFTKPVPLNTEEIQALKNYKPTVDQQQYYDLMILQIHTALRFSDVTRIVKNMVDDNFLVISPQKTQHTKTDNQIEIPLMPLCTAILKKYEYDTAHLLINKSTYNIKIKEICKQAFRKAKLKEIEITKKPTNKTGVEFTENKSKLLTSHNLRDTALSMMVMNKVDFHTILSIAGQSSYEILKLYVKTDRKYRFEEICRTFAVL
jgi:integrase